MCSALVGENRRKNCLLAKKNVTKLISDSNSKIEEFEDGHELYDCKIKSYADDYEAGQQMANEKKGNFIYCRLLTYSLAT